MRHAAMFLALLLFCPTLASAEDQAQPAATETVEFDGNVLGLASQEEEPGQSLKEYIPTGETLETWTKLAAIRQYKDFDDPKLMVGSLVKQLNKQYPESPSSIIENPTTGEVIVDFVVWPPDASFVEFNVFKYSKNPEGGLISEQYALREYNDAEGFLKGLRPVRERLVELMTDGLQPGQPVEVKTNAE
jgi:hypothetical protein